MSEDLPVAAQEQLDLLPLSPGSVLDERILILDEIGRGGMGVVYRCLDEDDTLCALKFVAPRKPEDSGQFKRRYVEEVKAMEFVRDMGHHCFPRIRHHDSIVSEGVQFPYYLMDFIDGVALYSEVIKHGPLPVDDAIEIGAQMFEGLAILHQETFHRDINPANVMRRWNGDVALIDLGLVRRRHRTNPNLTREFQTGPIGTPAFMPPEMARDEPIGAYTDIYLTGLTLYSLITGDLEPITGHNKIQKWVNAQKKQIGPPSRRIRKGDLTSLEKVEELDPFILKCTNLDPKRRYQSAQEALEALTPFRTSTRRCYLQPPLSFLVEDACWPLIPNDTFQWIVEQRYGGLLTLSPTFEDKCKYHLGTGQSTLADRRRKPQQNDSYLIGRGKKADIIINSNEVSSVHVRVFTTGDDWYIQPISTKITLVSESQYLTGTTKWKALEPGTIHPFTPGHWVRMGGIDRRIVTPSQLRNIISQTRQYDGCAEEIETKAVSYDEYQKNQQDPESQA